MSHSDVYGTIRGSQQTLSNKVQKELHTRDKRLDAHELLLRKLYQKNGINLANKLEEVPIDELEPRSTGSHHSPIDIEVNGDMPQPTHEVENVAMDCTPTTKVNIHFTTT